MTPNEFAAAWGGELWCADPVVLRDVRFAPAAQQFLAEAGLPREAGPGLTFYPAPALLAPLPDLLAEMDFPPDFRRYRVLGDDGGTFACVDTLPGGWVVAVDPYEELPTRFVNAAVAEFAACLLAYRALPGPEQARAVSKRVVRGWIDALRARIDAVDSEALRSADRWWAVIVEEMGVFAL